MASNEINKFDPIAAIIRTYLLMDGRILSWDGWNVKGKPDIYPRYISFIENAKFPCLTICRDYGMTDQNRTGYQRLFYYIHGWLKPPDATRSYSDVDEAAYLMQLITDILDTDRIRGNQIKEFAMCRLMDSICPAFNKESRTTYFMTRWRITASKNLMYQSMLKQKADSKTFWHDEFWGSYPSEVFWKGL